MSTAKQTTQAHHFPKAHRLLDRKQYQAVLGNGVRSSDVLLTVIARCNECHHSRLGVTVSKRVSKRAVDRNRLKRWFREDFRLLRQAGDGLDVVVIAKNAALGSSSETLRASVDKHWQRIKKKCNR